MGRIAKATVMGMISVLIGACAAQMSTQTHFSRTGLVDHCVVGQVDKAGGPRVSGCETLQRVEDPATGQGVWVPLAGWGGTGYGTGQTVANAAVGAAIQAAGFIAGTGIGAALTRPSSTNISVSQGGAIATSGAAAGAFAKGGNATAIQSQQQEQQQQQGQNACGSFYGC